jgi:L-threonylcarbamoyladenylate synthase
MTLILKRSEIAQDFITGGQDTVGVRVPDHVVALALLEVAHKVGIKGIAAPSANRFGQLSPTTATAVQSELGKYMRASDLVIDGGSCAVGVESTIIDCTADAPRVLRPGAITEEMIFESTGLQLLTHKAGEARIRVSGALDNHYAPIATVILDHEPIAGQGFIALAHINTPDGVVRLASPTDNNEFAHLLYAALREGDVQGLAQIVVAQPDGTDIAVAIRDRLMRAANSS